MGACQTDRQQSGFFICRRNTIAFLLFLVMCGAIAEYSSVGYLPGSGPRFISGKVSHWERDPKSDYPAAAIIALAVGGLALTADFRQAFVRFDRNQNRRLWPVVTSDLTRSPPASFIL